MLFKTLNKIRLKPKPVRNQYAFGIAVVFTAVLVGVWSLSLPTRFSGFANGIGEQTAGSAPFSNLIKQFKQEFGTAKDSVASIIIAASSTLPGVDFSTSSTKSITENSQKGQPVSIIIGTTSSTSNVVNQNYVQIVTSTSTSPND